MAGQRHRRPLLQLHAGPRLDPHRSEVRPARRRLSPAVRQDAFAAFDLFILSRAGAKADYGIPETARARAYYDALPQAGRDVLVGNIDAGRLRENLGYFLRAVVPVAEEVGIRLAIHPDDPPRPLLGLPRVVSTRSDLQWLLDAAPSVANGLTFCTGSLGVRADNDLVAMAGHFAPRIYFTHLRSTVREDTPLSFHEGSHVLGDVDLVGVIAKLVAEERRRESQGGPRIPLRPDHGHQLLDDQLREPSPGYSLIGRLKGLAEIRGAETAVRRLARSRHR